MQHAGAHSARADPAPVERDDGKRGRERQCRLASPPPPATAPFSRIRRLSAAGTAASTAENPPLGCSRRLARLSPPHCRRRRSTATTAIVRKVSSDTSHLHCSHQSPRAATQHPRRGPYPPGGGSRHAQQRSNRAEAPLFSQPRRRAPVAACTPLAPLPPPLGADEPPRLRLCCPGGRLGVARYRRRNHRSHPPQPSLFHRHVRFLRFSVPPPLLPRPPRLLPEPARLCRRRSSRRYIGGGRRPTRDIRQARNA